MKILGIIFLIYLIIDMEKLGNILVGCVSLMYYMLMVMVIDEM